MAVRSAAIFVPAGSYCHICICGMTPSTACEWGQQGSLMTLFGPFLTPQGVQVLRQTSACRAAKPRFLFNCCIKVAAGGLGWWDQSNQDAAEKAAPPAPVVMRSNPFASLWKCNLPLSFSSACLWQRSSSSFKAPLINRRRMMSDVTKMHRSADVLQLKQPDKQRRRLVSGAEKHLM